MAGDFNKPAAGDPYAQTFSDTRDMLSDVAKMLDATGTINPPTGAKRWNATNRYWEKNNGTPSSPSWGKMVDDASTRYEIRVWKADQLNSSQNFSITGDASASAVSFNGTGPVALSLTISNLAATKGGTGQTAWTAGQILYASANNVLSRLGVGTVGQVLRSTGALPAWATLANGDLPTTLSSKTLDNTNTATFKDNQLTLQDQTTASKQAQFECASLSTTRTFTFPDASGTFVLTGMSQTLTNKTFGAGNTWQGNAVAVSYGGTGETTWSSGAIPYFNGTKLTGAVLNGLVKANATAAPTAATAAEIVAAIGATAVQNATNATNAANATNATNVTGTIASGVTGTTQAAGTNNATMATTAFVKQEQNASTGASRVLLETVTASASPSMDFTTLGTAGYHRFELELSRVIPATDNVSCVVRFSTNGGSTFRSTNGDYATAHRAFDSGGTDRGGNDPTANGIRLNAAGTLNNTTANGGINAIVVIHVPSSTDRIHGKFSGTNIIHSTLELQEFDGGFITADYNAAVNALRVLMSTGNIASGVGRLYGIRS